MLSGAELNQLLMPAKSGAAFCTAATANVAAWSAASSPLRQGMAVLVRQAATTAAVAARKRIVMASSIIRRG
jgi:hypothetical protein